MEIQGNVLTAGENMWLTNGQTFSKQVWLGVQDSPDNWYEVDDAEVPDEWKPQNEEVL